MDGSHLTPKRAPTRRTMDDPSDAADAKSGLDLEPDTDGIDLAALQESSTTQTFETSTRERIERGVVLAE